MATIPKAWGAIRASLEQQSFHDIKRLVGLAGLDLMTLSSYEQKPQGGTSKGHLMTGVDGALGNMDELDRRHFVILLTEELLKKDSSLQEQIETDLWRSNQSIIPGTV